MLVSSRLFVCLSFTGDAGEGGPSTVSSHTHVQRHHATGTRTSRKVGELETNRLSLSLSLSHSVFLHLALSLSVNLSISLSVSSSLSPPWPPFRPSTLSLYFRMCLSVSVPLLLFMTSISLGGCIVLSLCLFLDVSFCPSLSLSRCLFLSLSVSFAHAQWCPPSPPFDKSLPIDHFCGYLVIQFIIFVAAAGSI